MQMTEQEKKHIRDELQDFIEMRVHSSNQTHEAMMRDMKRTLDQLSTDIKPVIEMFSNMRWGERILVKLGIFLGGLVAFLVGVVELVKLIANFHSK